MAHEIRPLAEADRPALARLLAESGLREQYDIFQGEEGLPGLVDDPHNHPGGVLVATEGGALVAFAVAHLLPGQPEGWAVARLGVAPARRRRGLGRALFAALERHAQAHRERLRLASFGTSAWVPDEAAEGFATAMGLAGERWFWLLERERGPIADPRWPGGIRVATFDGSDDERERWRQAYNESFASHYRAVDATPEEIRRLVASPTFRPDGTLLAWRGDEVVGFARNTLYGTRPELAVLGTTHAARGIGLGRALLRWSVRWMNANASERASLMVDGDNETALRLYRNEGFSVARRRRVWARPLAPSAPGDADPGASPAR